jgi:hypothetical protein
MAVLEMVRFTLALKPLFNLSCPSCKTTFHIDDTDFDLPPEKEARESMDSYWKTVAKDWANNYGLPPIGTILGGGGRRVKDATENNEFKITVRGFEIPAQPASNTVTVECSNCNESHNIDDLEYRHVPGAKGSEEFDEEIDEFHEATVWEVSQKLS